MTILLVQEKLMDIACGWMPRILTQIDRNPQSKTFGCADRNWWHYKIRDFPSIILQQAGYTTYIASELPKWQYSREELQSIAIASCMFWLKRAKRKGAFEEYYPYEQGYPPLAFSTLAVSKMVSSGLVNSSEVLPGILNATKQLVSRFEEQAANQQIAGLAALCWIHEIYPQMIKATDLERITLKSLALQNDEGWYEEYGGPDLGYLSVTLDCLWDAYDSTGDSRFLDSAELALNYMYKMIKFSNSSIGMHNSRNTDYIVPYGIARFAVSDLKKSVMAMHLLSILFANFQPAEHYLQSVDDRYLCHYIGHSVLRSVQLLANNLEEHDENLYSSTFKAEDVREECSHNKIMLPNSGHYLQYPKEDCLGVIITLKKGGIITIRNTEGKTASDYGWVVQRNNKTLVTHWWSNDWHYKLKKNKFIIQGYLIPVSDHHSTFIKHLLLRIASYFLGYRLIGFLKNKLIYSNTKSNIFYKRSISLEADYIVVEDLMQGLSPGVKIKPAPRASRRHVASANSYNVEDLQLFSDEWLVTNKVDNDGRQWKSSAIYSLKHVLNILLVI